MTTKEDEVTFSVFGMKCSLVDGKVKMLDCFSKPFSLLEQNTEFEADHEHTRLWEERLQYQIDYMRNNNPKLYEEWLNSKRLCMNQSLNDKE